MKQQNLYNELYKLAIKMHKINNRGVKYNLDVLLGQIPVRNNKRNSSTR